MTDHDFGGGAERHDQYPGSRLVVAGSSWNTVAGTTFTWVGVTEQYDLTSSEGAGIKTNGGFATGLALQSGRAVSTTVTDATAAGGAMAAMSWG
jgi:hypothetical protein